MAGFRIKGPNGNTMFLPAAGAEFIDKTGVGSQINYWTSSKDSFRSDSWILQGTATGYKLAVSFGSMYEYPIRPISTFEPATYKLTYMVDGEVYKSYENRAGKAITPEAAPAKDGYTFSGWSDIPETMPANDVTVTGTFTVNTYTITYMIGDEIFTTQTVTYGSAIVTPEAPTRQGCIFKWYNYPETMPAHDIVIEGGYITAIEEIKERLAKVKIYSTEGKPLDKFQKGLNIIVESDGTTRKMMVK